MIVILVNNCAFLNLESQILRERIHKETGHGLEIFPVKINTKGETLLSGIPKADIYFIFIQPNLIFTYLQPLHAYIGSILCVLSQLPAGRTFVVTPPFSEKNLNSHPRKDIETLSRELKIKEKQGMLCLVENTPLSYTQNEIVSPDEDFDPYQIFSHVASLHDGILAHIKKFNRKCPPRKN